MQQIVTFKKLEQGNSNDYSLIKQLILNKLMDFQSCCGLW